MKIKKLLLVLAIPLVLELIISCCDCPDPTIFYYTNCSLTINSLDNSGPEPIDVYTDPIPKDAYGIKVSVSRKQDICEVRRNHSIFIQSAYAYDCECGSEEEYHALDSIKTLSVSTVYEFDAAHLANSDVTDYFSVFTHPNSFNDIGYYVSRIETTYTEFLDETYSFNLLLMTPPTLGTYHKFNVIITLSDGRELFAETQKMELI